MPAYLAVTPVTVWSVEVHSSKQYKNDKICEVHVTVSLDRCNSKHNTEY